jgi:uncharacterized membrane protein YkvA (DUF1232 family)
MGQGEIERKKPRPEQEREVLGWLREFLSQFELAWKLVWDRRVSFFTKLVPLSLLGYLLMPFDLVPDALLGLGQVDDLVVILVGLRMFISLCPPDVVADLQGIEVRASDDADAGQPVKEIIDLEPEMLPSDKPGNGGPAT